MADITGNYDHAVWPYSSGIGAPKGHETWRNNFYVYTDNINNKIGFMSTD